MKLLRSLFIALGTLALFSTSSFAADRTVTLSVTGMV